MARKPVTHGFILREDKGKDAGKVHAECECTRWSSLLLPEGKDSEATLKAMHKLHVAQIALAVSQRG